MWLQQGKHIWMKIASWIWLRNETLDEPASQKKLYMIYCMYMYVIFVLSKLWKLPLCLNSHDNIAKCMIPIWLSLISLQTGASKNICKSRFWFSCRNDWYLCIYINLVCLQKNGDLRHRNGTVKSNGTTNGTVNGTANGVAHSNGTVHSNGHSRHHDSSFPVSIGELKQQLMSKLFWHNLIYKEIRLRPLLCKSVKTGLLVRFWIYE